MGRRKYTHYTTILNWKSVRKTRIFLQLKNVSWVSGSLLTKIKQCYCLKLWQCDVKEENLLMNEGSYIKSWENARKLIYDVGFTIIAYMHRLLICLFLCIILVSSRISDEKPVKGTRVELWFRVSLVARCLGLLLFTLIEWLTLGLSCDRRFCTLNKAGYISAALPYTKKIGINENQTKAFDYITILKRNRRFGYYYK